MPEHQRGLDGVVDLGGPGAGGPADHDDVEGATDHRRDGQHPRRGGLQLGEPLPDDVADPTGDRAPRRRLAGGERPFADQQPDQLGDVEGVAVGPLGQGSGDILGHGDARVVADPRGDRLGTQAR